MNQLEIELQEEYPDARCNSFFSSKLKGSQAVKRSIYRFHSDNKPEDKNLPVAFLIVTKHNRFRGSPHVGLGIKAYREGKPQRNTIYRFLFLMFLI